MKLSGNTRRPVVTAAVALALALAGAVGGCSYAGTARPIRPASLAAMNTDGALSLIPNFPIVQQSSSSDCGAAVTLAVLEYWGKMTNPKTLREQLGDRSSAASVRDVLREHGLAAFVVRGTTADLDEQLNRGRPLIVGLVKPYQGKDNVTHYEVVIGLRRATREVLTMDPSKGQVLIRPASGFVAEWGASGFVTLVAFAQDKMSRR